MSLKKRRFFIAAYENECQKIDNLLNRYKEGEITSNQVRVAIGLAPIDDLWYALKGLPNGIRG